MSDTTTTSADRSGPILVLGPGAEQSGLADTLRSQGYAVKSVSSGQADRAGSAFTLLGQDPSASAISAALEAGTLPIRVDDTPEGPIEVVIAAADGHAADPEAVAHGLRLLRGTGRPILPVRPTASAGLFVDRVRDAYLNEALALVGDGISAARVEAAAEAAGLRPGPLARLDEVSLERSDRLLHAEMHDHAHDHDHDHGHRHGHGHDHSHDHGHDHGHGHGHEHQHGHAHGHGHADGHGRAHDHHDHGHGHDHAHDHDHDHGHGHGHAHEHDHDHAHGHDHPDAHAHADVAPSPRIRRRMTESAVYVMEKMAHGFNRTGRADGGGFYDYDDEDGSRSLWSGLKTFERRAKSISDDDIRDRLIYAQVIEALHCRAEGVVGDEDRDAADRASIAGWGFPADAGGAASYPDRIGRARFEARAAELAAAYGDRFALPPR